MDNDDEKVLSQADVDALVALVPTAPRAAAVSAAEPPQAVETAFSAQEEPVAVDISDNEAGSSPAPSSEEIQNIQKSLADMAVQIIKLNESMHRIDTLEERTGKLAKSVNQPSVNVQSIESRVDDLQTQIQTLFQTVNNKRELKEEFQCSHCKSKATVAFYTKCTTCGHEKWFGWWPAKKSP